MTQQFHSLVFAQRSWKLMSTQKFAHRCLWFIVQSLNCVQLCDPMNCSTSGFPVLHHLLEFSQTHVHWVKWCHQTISPSVALFCSCLHFFPALLVFSNESALCIWWPKYCSFSIRPSSEYSGLISFKMTGCSPCCPRDFQESSLIPQLKSINSSAVSLL